MHYCINLHPQYVVCYVTQAATIPVLVVLVGSSRITERHNTYCTRMYYHTDGCILHALPSVVVLVHATHTLHVEDM
jgi:hypothetical protein